MSLSLNNQNTNIQSRFVFRKEIFTEKSQIMLFIHFIKHQHDLNKFCFVLFCFHFISLHFFCFMLCAFCFLFFVFCFLLFVFCFVLCAFCFVLWSGHFMNKKMKDFWKWIILLFNLFISKTKIFWLNQRSYLIIWLFDYLIIWCKYNVKNMNLDHVNEILSKIKYSKIF
jgi:hypothetical protein